MVHLGDIKKIHDPPFVDCITFGSPCQDLSIAGKRAGARLQHLWVIAMMQAGLSPKTINRVSGILPIVCAKFDEYKRAGLADEWMKAQLAGKDIPLPEPKESEM